MIKLNYEKVEKTQNHIVLDETKEFYLKGQDGDKKILLLYNPNKTEDNLINLEKDRDYNIVHYGVFTFNEVIINGLASKYNDIEIITKEEFKTIYEEWFKLLLDEVKDD